MKCPRHCYRLLIAATAAAIVLLCAAAPVLAADEGEQPNPGDWGQALFTVVVFVLLLLVLGKFGWKPIINQIHQRERSISDAIRKADQREKDAQELLANYSKRLENAQADAEEVLSRGRREAAEAREQILQAAREEAHRASAKAQDELERAKQSALRELRDTTAELAADIAGRLLRRNLTTEDHRQLLNQSFQEISEQASERV